MCSHYRLFVWNSIGLHYIGTGPDFCLDSSMGSPFIDGYFMMGVTRPCYSFHAVYLNGLLLCTLFATSILRHEVFRIVLDEISCVLFWFEPIPTHLVLGFSIFSDGSRPTCWPHICSDNRRTRRFVRDTHWCADLNLSYLGTTMCCTVSPLHFFLLQISCQFIPHWGLVYVHQ